MLHSWVSIWFSLTKEKSSSSLKWMVVFELGKKVGLLQLQDKEKGMDGLVGDGERN